MRIQQCRLFFVATATSNTNLKEVGYCVWKRCFCPCGWIAVTLSAALLFGCSSLTPERVSVLSQIAGQAVQFGASQWLAKHPDHRQSFEAIVLALSGLVKAGNYNENAWTELLSSLPVNALEGPEGAFYVSEGLVVWDGALKKPVAVRGEATPAVLRATYIALRNAVGPKPPVPGREKTLKGIVPEGRPAPVPVVAEPMRDPMRDYVPEHHGIGLKTNVSPLTRVSGLSVDSTFDVTLNEHGVQQVNVRWNMDPNASYTVQRMEENKAWEGFASATNTNAVSTTCLWRTLWHHQCPVGNWRVVRR